MTPVRATLHARCDDANSSVGPLSDAGNGGRSETADIDLEEAKGRGRDVKFSRMSKIEMETFNNWFNYKEQKDILGITE